MQHSSNLKNAYLLFSFLLFIILTGRLIQLQLLERDKYYRESERNRVREVVIKPPRGQFFDRNHKVLVDNRPSYSVSVIPFEFLKSDSAVRLLSSILEQPRDQIVKKVRKEKIGNFNPVNVRRQLSFRMLSSIEEHRLELPGVFYNTESKRFYPGGVRAPHMFGYLGEITTSELKKVDKDEYKQGDVIGKNGLEYQYESILRGRSGIQYVEVDVLGREVGTLAEFPQVEPEPGHNLLLTIDSGIQKHLEERMSEMRGAAVVLDARNGEILALLNKPDYDPEIFSNVITSDVWNTLINHEDKPLYARATQSLYPPGSIYKMVLAAAGLETNLIDLNQTVLCEGSFRLGRRNFDCWKPGGHGEVNLYGAIEGSCNVYFYRMGLVIGLENWTKYSRIFNFGKKTKIDLPNESAGSVPDKSYFDTKYGENNWTKGLLVNLSVGQGDLLVTPLQMAYFAMTVGNEGVAYQPHLLRQIENPGTGETVDAIFDSFKVTDISSETFRHLKQGMYMVVNGQNGTAKSARLPNIKVCGKTGTAQNPHGKSHAWFICFAPMESPEIAFAILVENGGSGGAVAAPIGRGILSMYFDNRELAGN